METSFFSKVLLVAEWIGAVGVAIFLIIGVVALAAAILKESFIPALLAAAVLTVVGTPLCLGGLWAYSQYQADHPSSIVYNGTRYSVGQVVQGRKIASFKKNAAGEWYAIFATAP